MAKKYISREAAEILMCDACEYDCKYHERVSGRSLITADDCYHLRDLYAIHADVAEVRRGHWIVDREDVEWGNSLIRYRCSECRERPHFDKEKYKFILSPYCPNCGAKMDESESEK